MFREISKASGNSTASRHNNSTKQVMENPESKSSWDDLTREVGVEVPPETIQRAEAVATGAHQAPPAPVSRRQEAEHTPPPKRSNTDWNSLASELGLPPSPEPDPQPEAATPAAPEVRRVPRESLRPERPQREREEGRERRPEESRGERRPRPEGRDRGRRPRRDEREQQDQSED